MRVVGVIGSDVWFRTIFLNAAVRCGSCIEELIGRLVRSLFLLVLQGRPLQVRCNSLDLVVGLLIAVDAVGLLGSLIGLETLDLLLGLVDVL